MEDEFNNLKTNFGTIGGANLLTFAEFVVLPESIVEGLLMQVSINVAGRLAEMRDQRRRHQDGGGQDPFAFPVPSQPLIPPSPLIEDFAFFTLQFILFTIDGTKAHLTSYGGFRAYVKAECTTMGLRSYVWRVPSVHGKILACGTRGQLGEMIDFIRRLQRFGFISTFHPESPELTTSTETFDIRLSSERRVETEEFVDEASDEVMSIESADIPIFHQQIDFS